MKPQLDKSLLDEPIGDDMGFGKESEISDARAKQRSPEIITRSEPIIIGLPTNSRMADDLKPLREVMRLEGKQGVLKSPDIPNVIFRELRASDIAELLLANNPTMKLGFIGQDTMIEQSLQRGTRDRITEIMELDPGDPVKMRVLVRRNERMRLSENGWQRIVTSYPTITSNAVLEPLQSFLSRFFSREYRPPSLRPSRFDRIELKVADGKVESLVRNQDFGPTIAGVDIVRKGNTAREFELEPIGDPVLVSRPALFGSGNIANQITLAADCIGSIREKLKEASILFRDGDGFDFYKRLKPWKAP